MCPFTPLIRASVRVSVRSCVHMFVCVHLFVRPFAVRPSVHVSVDSVNPCIRAYVRSFVCPYVRPRLTVLVYPLVSLSMRTSVIIFFINCDLIVKIPGGSMPTTPVITEPVREFIVGLGTLDVAHVHFLIARLNYLRCY